MATVAGAVLAAQFVVLQSSAPGHRTGVILGVLFGAGVAALLMVSLLGTVTQLASRQAALRWGSIYLVAVTLPFLFLQDLWLLWWLLVSLGLAWVLPLRVSLAFTAGRDLEASSTRLLTLGIFYSLAAAFAAWVLGFALWRLEGPGLPLPLGYALVSFVIALAATLAPPFAEEARPAPVSWNQAFRNLWAVKSFRWALLLGGLARGGLIALIAWLALSPHLVSALDGLKAITFFLFGAAMGCLITALEPHPRRVLGILPPALTGLAVMLFVLAGAEDSFYYVPALGWVVGFLLSPLHNALLVDLEEEELFAADILRRAADFLGAGLWGVLFVGLSDAAGLPPFSVLLGVAALATVAAALVWVRRRRESAELVVEALTSIFYRIEGVGPGLKRFPRRGPAVIIANHASWFDPLYLGKIIPRKIIPMMTSLFYDLPGVRWLMVHMAQAIRVEVGGFRRAVPELAEAVATLDRGDVLVVFPEGAMRKSEEEMLQRFGRGVIHILRERPRVPIFACWIEGGWGSFTSYYNGKPTKNKRMDFRRPIRVAVAAPFVLDPELMDDHRAGRKHLRQVVLEARTLLGLEAPALEQLESKPESTA
jgi:1-acyl-sn-glycerol-3-phosphate acyltransferase